MDNTFQIRVHSAAVAGWWTFLIAFAFLMVQWAIYLGMMAAQPSWAVAFWGRGATWETIRPIWLQALVLVKLTLWPLGLAAIWLTLWARQLRKGARRPL